MTRTFTIPQGQAKKLIAFAKAYEEEVAGRLLYRQEGNKCIVDGGYLTGSGTETSLSEDDEALEVVQTFLNRNPDWNQAPYHTHTRKTIDRHGDHFEQNWSQQDRDQIEEGMRRDPEYMAVLATPEAILVDGTDNPELKVLQSQEETSYNEAVGDSLDKIADELGYEEDWDLTEY